MDKLFLTILNMSLTGAFVIGAICLARLPLKKAPKIISYCLWAVAGFRLVFPFSIESIFSLIPFKAQTIPTDIVMQPVPRIDSGIPFVNNAVSSILPAAKPTASVNPLQIWMATGAWLWFGGVAVLFIYGVVSFFILKRNMREAAHIEANIYEAENIKSPCVLGVFKPKIYLPIGLSGQEKIYIILHEQTHIRRHDHIIKFVAYFILCVHWFNPLAWVAFLLMGVDMEMSCDERVLKEMGGEIKKDYSLSLLSLATERRIIGGSPLAFGEGGVKGRIKNVLNFKKPSRMIIVVSVALVAVLSAGFAVNRATDGNILNSFIPMSMKNVDKEPHFAGTVTEVHDNAILVSVNEGEDARRSSDLISVSLNVKLKDSMTHFTVGDKVIVYYNGEIAESYPAQVNTVYAIILTSPDMQITSSDENISDIAQRVEDGLFVIMSSPLSSSNPQDYINEHWEEYENLTMKYPDGVLEYLISQFEAGNSSGLRGQIMMRMCKDMLGVQNNVTDESLSPQEWYRQLSIISEIKLPDFKPENPSGVYDGEVDGKVYGGIFNSAILQQYGGSESGFLMYAPTIYGAYEESGKLKVFVTVYYEYYRLYGSTLESTGGAVIPGAIIFRSGDYSSGWEFEEFLEVVSANLPDGAYFGDSIRKLCVMPVSGNEIKGLAEKMTSDYANDARRGLLMQSLKEHLTAHGQTGVSLKKPDDSMIELN